MTDFEAYQEYIQRKHNAFCKAVVRYAARDKILQLRRKWERQISLDYLMDEKREGFLFWLSIFKSFLRQISYR